MSTVLGATRNLAARWSSPIVLYHSTYDVVPAELGAGVHNVDPDTLCRQLEWLSASFRFLSVDEWFAEGRPNGTACVTFDDGYRSVCESVLPRLVEMNIPATMFLNGSSLCGEVFWRDKVLLLLNRGLVDSFVSTEIARDAGLDDLTADTFYRGTKHPSRNSKVVDLALDAYLEQHDLVDELPRETVTSRDDLVHHPLITYGNHSHRHYIPRSLDEDGQRAEFIECERVLDDLALNRSNVLSIPFGGRVHVDETTEAIVSEMDFSAVVFSSNAVNFSRHRSPWAGLPAADRYMATESHDAFMRRHARLSYLRPDSPLRTVARTARNRIRSVVR